MSGISKRSSTTHTYRCHEVQFENEAQYPPAVRKELSQNIRHNLGPPGSVQEHQRFKGEEQTQKIQTNFLTNTWSEGTCRPARD
jgi:hypothetical protein